MWSDDVGAGRRVAREEGGGGAVVVWFAPRAVGDRAAAAVAALVGLRRRVPMELLLHRSRCKPEVAEARMLAMYLTHVVLGRTYSEVGQFFGRDRTTVAHACARIEDRRDEPRFEDEVAAFEAAIGTIGVEGGGARRAAG